MLHRDPSPSFGRAAAILLALALAPLSCGDDGEATDSGSTAEPTSEGGDPSTSAATDGGGETGGSTTSGPDDDSDTDEPADSSDSGEPPLCSHEVACEDAVILDLGFVEDVTSDGAVTSMPDGPGFVSEIDASAGGLPNASMNPWVYLRFTDAGLERVEVDDVQSLASHDWHIAAKRFGIRLNSGTGGPSCVQAAAIDGSTYDELDAVPAGLELAEEAFYDERCVLVDDGSGQGSPAYLLTPWWGYAGCVTTTGVPFVLQLPDGRALKLVVDAYYGSGQVECNETGAMGSDSAHFTWRWSFLE